MEKSDIEGVLLRQNLLLVFKVLQVIEHHLFFGSNYFLTFSDETLLFCLHFGVVGFHQVSEWHFVDFVYSNSCFHVKKYSHEIYQQNYKHNRPKHSSDQLQLVSLKLPVRVHYIIQKKLFFILLGFHYFLLKFTVKLQLDYLAHQSWSSKFTSKQSIGS